MRSYYNLYIPFGEINRLKEILSSEQNLNVYINPILKHDMKDFEKVETRLEVNIHGDNHRKNIETLIKIHDGEIICSNNVGELPISERIKIFFKKYAPLASTVYASGVTTALVAKWEAIFNNGDVMGVVSIALLNLLVATSAILIVMRFNTE